MGATYCRSIWRFPSLSCPTDKPFPGVSLPFRVRAGEPVKGDPLRRYITAPKYHTPVNHLSNWHWQRRVDQNIKVISFYLVRNDNKRARNTTTKQNTKLPKWPERHVHVNKVTALTSHTHWPSFRLTAQMQSKRRSLKCLKWPLWAAIDKIIIRRVKSDQNTIGLLKFRSNCDSRCVRPLKASRSRCKCYIIWKAYGLKKNILPKSLTISFCHGYIRSLYGCARTSLWPHPQRPLSVGSRCAWRQSRAMPNVYTMAEHMDSDSDNFSSDISLDEDDDPSLNREILTTDCSGGVQPYLFEPEASSSDESDGSNASRQSNNSDAGEQAEGERRLEELFWFVFVVIVQLIYAQNNLYLRHYTGTGPCMNRGKLFLSLNADELGYFLFFMALFICRSSTVDPRQSTVQPI